MSTKAAAGVREETITLAHGSGGRAMRNLVAELFVRKFDNPLLGALEDQARIDLAAINAVGDRLAFTTDTYVVSPLFFPGGDIGQLAVNGTINDLAVGGATPLYLSCAIVLAEGFPVASLRRVADSMRDAALAAGVQIVTGDTKVVERGACDGVFVNTAGIGVIARGLTLAADSARPGDRVLVSGTLGDHGAAILVARNELQLESAIASDCQPLHRLVIAMLAASPRIRCMRDATRGGVATVLAEFATSSRIGIRIHETAIPIRPEVRGLCEIVGLDPLYLANEGKLVAIVPPESAQVVLDAMRNDPSGRDAACIGEVVATPAGIVTIETALGGTRTVDLLVGDQLPRIC